MTPRTPLDEESITRLFKLKSKLSQSLADLAEDKLTVKQNIQSIREEKEELRALKSSETIKSYNIKVNLKAAERQLATYQKNLKESRIKVDNFEEFLSEEINLNNFEQTISKLVSSVEAAINMYQEDSLQMELLKRTNCVREKRVEYTNLETHYKELEKKIAQQKKDIFRSPVVKPVNDSISHSPVVADLIDDSKPSILSAIGLSQLLRW